MGNLVTRKPKTEKNDGAYFWCPVLRTCGRDRRFQIMQNDIVVPNMDPGDPILSKLCSMLMLRLLCYIANYLKRGNKMICLASLSLSLRSSLLCKCRLQYLITLYFYILLSQRHNAYTPSPWWKICFQIKLNTLSFSLLYVCPNRNFWSGN